MAPGGGASGRVDDGRGMAGLSSSSARRGAWSLTRGRSGAPSACQRSTALGDRRAAPAGSCGSRQPNMSPELRPRAGERRGLGRLGLPRQLERPAGDEPASSSRAARDRSTASPSAARRSRSARPGARRPGARGSRRPRRCRPARRGRAGFGRDVVEAASPGRASGAQISAASPTLQRPARPLGLAGLEPLEVRGEPLGELGGSRGPAARGARPRHRAAARNSDAGRSTTSSSAPTVRWSVGSKARSESISSPKNSTRTGSGADGGKTSTMPPRRANSPRPATSAAGA